MMMVQIISKYRVKIIFKFIQRMSMANPRKGIQIEGETFIRASRVNTFLVQRIVGDIKDMTLSSSHAPCDYYSQIN